MTQGKLVFILLSILSLCIYFTGNYVKENKKENKRQEAKFETILDVDFERYLVVSEDDEKVCIVERKNIECYTRQH